MALSTSARKRLQVALAHDSLGTELADAVDSGTTVTIDEVPLAEGSILVGNSSGAGAAVVAKTSGQILVGNGTTLASVAVSGDTTLAANGAVTIANNAVTTAKINAGAVTTAKIGDAQVTAAKLADGAGVAALLTAGAGASAAYTKATNGAQTLMAANAFGNRAAIFVAVVTETFADGDGTQPTFSIGETGSAAKFAATSAFTGATAGTVLAFAGQVDINDAILVTAVAATGATSTGAISVTVLSLPSA